ncbi:MAG: S9 family peptidase [Symbiobacteriaceae bacterium]|nr:S9 family peptidase [Symbiobacteriaceae bacterium]
MSQKPFTPEDMLKLKTIGQMQIAPDGSLVVYELRESSAETDESKTDLWWVKTNGEGEPQRLTFTGKESSPSWSPDSQKLAFISSRGSKPQIHLLDRQGGEAQVLKTVPRAAGSLLWAPDGSGLAFSSRKEITIEGARHPGEPEHIWRKAAKDLAERGSTAERSGASQPRRTAPVNVITEMDYRADGRGLTYEQIQQLYFYKLQDGTCQELTNITGPNPKRLGNFTWWGADKLVYALSWLNLEPPRTYAEVYAVSPKGDTPQLLFSFAGSVSSLRWAPDLKSLLFTSTRAEIPQGTAPAEIWLWREGMSAPVSLTQDLDRSCRAVTWLGKGEAICYTKEENATSKIYQRELLEDHLGAEKLLATGELHHVSTLSVSDDGLMAYIASNETTVPQIYLKSPGAGDDLTLTQINEDYLEEGYFCPAEVIHFKGPKEWDVEGFIIKPKGYIEGKPVPTILDVHGGPTGVFNRNFTPAHQMMAHAGYAVLYINPRGSTSYGTKFTQGILGDWGGDDFLDIMAGVDVAIAKGIADPERIGITGWSYGGYMTYWAVSQTNRFKAAVGGAGISNVYTMFGCSVLGVSYDEPLMGGPAFDLEELYMSRSAIRHVRKVETPLMMLHGDSDINCPLEQSTQYYTALKRLGKEATLVRYPGQPHGLGVPSYQLDRWQRTMGWFGHYLLG